MAISLPIANIPSCVAVVVKSECALESPGASVMIQLVRQHQGLFQRVWGRGLRACVSNKRPGEDVSLGPTI